MITKTPNDKMIEEVEKEKKDEAKKNFKRLRARICS